MPSHLRTLLTATSFAIAVAGPTLAADLRLKAPAPMPPPVYNWTGCYIGGNGGYARAQSGHNFQFDDVTDAFNTTEFYFTNNFLSDGGVIGIHGGCNYQTGKIVLGIEGDYSWLNANTSYSFAEPNGADTANFSMNLKNLASVRGRVGYAEDRVLFYATAGVAWARFNYSYNLNDADVGTSNQSLSFSPTGIVFGAGVEYAMWKNVILRAEYLHYAFGNDYALPTNLLANDIGPGLNDHVTFKSVDEIRVGASYLFNWR
jgi:outer membrane immunogenic protein